MSIVELTITALAAGGDGVARDDGRVTFVPRTAPGDRVRARIVKTTASYARGELVEVVAPGPSRVAAPCRYFEAGCGGCAWQHVARGEQLAAKQAFVASALRHHASLRVHPIEDPGPPLGWRRRARFHVAGGEVGLFAAASHRVIAIASCPQLVPALDRALGEVIAAHPPDGELALALGHRGEVVVGVHTPWPNAAPLVGRAGIVGVLTGDARFGEPTVEIEPGLVGGPWDFAQASELGNRALVDRVLAVVGPGPGRLLELYAGAGNFTRGIVAAGWDVTATDAVAPAAPPATRFEVGPVDRVLAALTTAYDAVVLDPPRSGASEAIAGIVRIAAPRVIYISCDPATLARDAGKLADAGYVAHEAWPLDVMSHTAHVEVVLLLERA
jgi:23S rRNA (uracil1939-C5)-methyltransferase